MNLVNDFYFSSLTCPYFGYTKHHGLNQPAASFPSPPVLNIACKRPFPAGYILHLYFINNLHGG